MASLLELFAAAVERHPERVAIVDGKGRQTSFRGLDARTKTLAARWQAQGVKPGDRVVLAMGISTDLYASLAALWSIGATVVLPEPAMGLAGLRHAIRTTGPTAFCAAGWYLLLKGLLPELWSLSLLRPGHGTGPVRPAGTTGEDIALISFTSGTTGAPKAIPRTHAFLRAQYDAVAPLLESAAEDRDLVTFPVFTLVNLAEGRTSVLPNWTMRRLAQLQPAEVADWLCAQRVTRLLAPPALCELLLKNTVPKALHTIFTGGGPVFPDLVAELTQKTGATVICIYGSTEAEPIAHLTGAEISDRDRAAMAEGRGLLVGEPVPQVQIRISDTEVQVAGPHVNEGYLDPAQNAENKVIEAGRTWHRTGDAGVFDEKGRLWLLGRVGSEVTTQTGTVYPFAIEVAARQWPGVHRSALMSRNGTPVLVVEGDAQHRAAWEAAAQPFGVDEVFPVGQIPMDRRHNSKVDRKKLKALISGQP